MALHKPVGRRAALAGLATALTLPRLVGAARLTLTLATGTRAPFISEGGAPGFVEELVRDACARIGIDLVVLQLPPERALINANSGVEDGDLFRTPGFEHEYPNLIRVPQPLINLDFVAFVMRADIEIRGWSDLARYRVAHLTGVKVLEQRLGDAPNVTRVRSNPLLLDLLGSGRADVIITGRWVGEEYARRASQKARALEPPLLRLPMYIYLHRRHAALVEPLADALAQGRRDGTWTRLYDRILKPLEIGL